MKSLTFQGKGTEYFDIWIINILLVIVTLGLYYPWAKVRNKRYFYGNTTFDGHNFDYHATGKQLFLSFLIAFSFLIVYSILIQFFPVLDFFFFPVLFILLPWVVWRSVQFNARVTSFSNVRFSFTGSLKVAYFCYLLLPLLLMLAFYGPFIIIGASAAFDMNISIALIGVIVVLGLVLSVFAFAFMKVKNTGYILNGYRFGQGEFSTHLNVRPFVIILLQTIGIAIVFIVFVAIVIFLLMMSLGTFADINSNTTLGSEESVNLSNHYMVAAAGFIAPLYVVFIVCGIFVNAYFQAKTREYIFDHLTLDNNIIFKSTLDPIKFGWLLVTNLLLLVFTMGLATPWTKVRKAKMLVENTWVGGDVDFSHYMSEQHAAQSALGDQLGDAFDVGIDVAI